jgi:hypothetical protein
MTTLRQADRPLPAVHSLRAAVLALGIAALLSACATGTLTPVAYDPAHPFAQDLVNEN